MDQQPTNPLHGVTLEKILTQLVDHYGWAEMGRAVDIRCFNVDPSIASSLKFLRRTPWARKKVEEMYLRRERGLLRKRRRRAEGVGRAVPGPPRVPKQKP